MTCLSRATRLLVLFAAAVSATAVSAVASELAFQGEWSNVDNKATDITRVRIAKTDRGWTIETWGKAGAKEISAGSTKLHLLGADPKDTRRDYGFATWDLTFKKRHTTLRVKYKLLVIESFNITTSDTGRGNYFRRDTFQRNEAP